MTAQIGAVELRSVFNIHRVKLLVKILVVRVVSVKLAARYARKISPYLGATVANFFNAEEVCVEVLLNFEGCIFAVIVVDHTEGKRKLFGF